MKKGIKKVIFVVFTTFLLSSSVTKPKPLIISITNVKTTNGNVRVGIYKKGNDFPNEKDTYQNKVYKVTKTGSILIKIEDLPYGEYAIGIYQDENKNATLDKNFVGAPKEPFAFSNNVKPLFTAPDFEECRFQYAENNVRMNLKLLNY